MNKKLIFLPLVSTILLSSCGFKSSFKKAKAFILENRPEEIGVKHYDPETHLMDQVGTYYDFSAIGKKATIVFQSKYNAFRVFDELLETKKVTYDLEENYLLVETTRSNNYHNIAYTSVCDAETLHTINVIEDLSDLENKNVLNDKYKGYFCSYFGYYVSNCLSRDLIEGSFLMNSIYNFLDSDYSDFKDEFSFYKFKISNGELHGKQVANCYYCDQAGNLYLPGKHENDDDLKVKLKCNFVTLKNGFIKEGETKFVVDKTEYLLSSMKIIDFDAAHKDIINQYLN